jgi:NAD+ kinase
MAVSRLQLRPRRIGVAVKPSSPEAATLGERLLAELSRRGVEGVVDEESAQAVGRAAGPPRSELGRCADLVIVLGGDGTFLSVARGCPADTPIAGINLGSLGFLTEHAPDRTFALLDELLSGSIVVERRGRLAAHIGDRTDRPDDLVLNDVVVTNATLARILTLLVEVDGEPLSRYRADGLILATPTGSTAYNLSAGGPVVHPWLDAILITPICAHTLSDRPLVVPGDVRLRLVVEKGPEDVVVTLDGQVGYSLPPGGEVHVRMSDQPLTVVSDATGSFFGILHRKLKWGQRDE